MNASNPLPDEPTIELDLDPKGTQPFERPEALGPSGATSTDELGGDLPDAVVRMAFSTGLAGLATEVPVMLRGMHAERDCQGPCPWHSARAHLLAGQPLRVLFVPSGGDVVPILAQRACPKTEGRWHPDADSALWLASRVDPAGFALAMAHDCDGCCTSTALDLLMRDELVAPEPARLLRLRTLYSTYEWQLGGRVRRVEGVNPPTASFARGGEWRSLALASTPVQGQAWVLVGQDGVVTVTSLVTSIQAVST